MNKIPWWILGLLGGMSFFLTSCGTPTQIFGWSSTQGMLIAREENNTGTNLYWVQNGKGYVKFGEPQDGGGYTLTTDGKWIAFASTRDGNSEIYVMNADGSNQTRVTYNATEDTEPAWLLLDGTRKLAFSSNRDGNWEIYIMNADGTNQIRLTDNSFMDTSPTWSPDGTKIAFVSNRDGNDEIYMMNANGSNYTRLTNDSATDTDPVWSPDGKRIAFVSIRGEGKPEICVMNADNFGKIMVVGSSNASNPIWSQDSKELAFLSNGEIKTMDLVSIMLQ